MNLAHFNSETWCILPHALHTAIDEVRHSTPSRRVKLPRVNGTVAILPVHGMITQRGGPFDEIFGGTATQGFEAAFQHAVDSPRIKAVVLDVDSPGGELSGVEQAADRVFAARGSKPIVAVANSLAASAAYWIGSAADSFVAVPGSEVGSIGAFRIHVDKSKALADAGVKVTMIASSPEKVEVSPFEPLSEDALAHQQELVMNTAKIFDGAVARHRGVSPAVVRSEMGRGRVFKSDQAAKRGMVDRVASLGRVLTELGVGTGKARTSEAAEADILADILAAWGGEAEPRKPRSVKLLRRKLDLVS